MADGLAQKAFLDREPNLQMIGADDLDRIRRNGVWAALGLGGQKRLGIGVLGVGKDLGRRPGLHNLAALHHADPVSDAPHDAQIMGDEQHRQPLGRLQLGQQVQDLRLHRHIQRRRRLIGNEQLRPIGQRHRDHHPLALPARQLVRIGGQPFFGIADADPQKKRQRPLPRRLTLQRLMQREAFANLPLNRVQGVQTGHRLLEDKADVIAPHPTQFPLARPNHLAAKVGDRPAHNRIVRQQPDGRQRRDRLARPAFAHQGHGFPLGHGERHALNRRDHPAILTEADIQPFDIQNNRHWKVFLGSKASRTPSKMNTKSESMMAKVKKVTKAKDGICKFCCAWRDNCPNEGNSGGRPKPR